MNHVHRSLTALSCLMLGSALASPSLHALQQRAYECAAEGSTCALRHQDLRYTVSYGFENGFFLLTLEGVPSVPCEDYVFGVPTGKRSTCKALPVEPIPQEKDYTDCAYGRTCKVDLPNGEYVLARYGDKATNRWIYNYVASDFHCSRAAFGFGIMTARPLGKPLWGGKLHPPTYVLDPAPNVPKSCQYSAPIKAIPGEPGAAAQWETCAQGGNYCKLPSEGTYIVRYGVDKRWLYREFSGSEFPCSSGNFGYDIAENVHKFCEFLVAPQIKLVNGSWVKLVQCEGCLSEEYEYKIGVEQGQERSKTSSWSIELSVTLEETSGVEGVGSSKVATTFSTSKGGSRSITDSFTKKAEKTVKTTCNKGALWQWTTTVEDFCRPTSESCITVARATEFKCVSPSEEPTWGAP